MPRHGESKLLWGGQERPHGGFYFVHNPGVAETPDMRDAGEISGLLPRKAGGSPWLRVLSKTAVAAYSWLAEQNGYPHISKAPTSRKQRFWAFPINARNRPP